jgi:hypothetical protein
VSCITKAKKLKEYLDATYAKLSAKFLGNDAQLMSQKELKYLKEGGKGKNYYKEIKGKVMYVLEKIALVMIVYAYLAILGLE